MGADGVAAWLGAALIAVMSFTPAIMAPSRQARDLAGRAARLSLPVTGALVAWATLSSLQLTPPPGGVVASGLSLLMIVPMALAAWGVGLVLRAGVSALLGWTVPHGATLRSEPARWR